MRYAQGGGLTDAGRAARERLRLHAVERFQAGEKNAEVGSAERNLLGVSLEPSALAALGLEDTEIEAVLEASAEDIARFREVLPQVLAYGREDARPDRVEV